MTRLKSRWSLLSLRSAPGQAARGARRIIGLRWRQLYSTQQTFGQTLLECSAELVRRNCTEALGGFATPLRNMVDVDLHTRLPALCCLLRGPHLLVLPNRTLADA